MFQDINQLRPVHYCLDCLDCLDCLGSLGSSGSFGSLSSFGILTGLGHLQISVRPSQAIRKN